MTRVRYLRSAGSTRAALAMPAVAPAPTLGANTAASITKTPPPILAAAQKAVEIPAAAEILAQASADGGNLYLRHGHADNANSAENGATGFAYVAGMPPKFRPTLQA